MRATVPAEELRDDVLAEYFIGFRKEQCFFTYHRCGTCGVLWNPIYFTQAALDHLYSTMPENVGVSGERDSARTQAGYAQLLRISPQAKIAYLELGADVGFLAREVVSAGVVRSADAVEPNLEVHDELAENLGPGGRVFTDLSEVPAEPAYDIVTAIHVMDHLLEPKSVLRDVAERLRSGGRLFIVVHDESSLLRKALGRKWAPFCLQHPQLYRPSTLGRLLNEAGFRVSGQDKTTNWLSVRQAGSLAASIGLFPDKGARMLPDIALPAKLGNMGVMAQWP